MRKIHHEATKITKKIRKGKIGDEKSWLLFFVSFVTSWWIV